MTTLSILVIAAFGAIAGIIAFFAVKLSKNGNNNVNISTPKNDETYKYKETVTETVTKVTPAVNSQPKKENKPSTSQRVVTSDKRKASSPSSQRTNNNTSITNFEAIDSVRFYDDDANRGRGGASGGAGSSRSWADESASSVSDHSSSSSHSSSSYSSSSSNDYSSSSSFSSSDSGSSSSSFD